MEGGFGGNAVDEIVFGYTEKRRRRFCCHRKHRKAQKNAEEDFIVAYI